MKKLIKIQKKEQKKKLKPVFKPKRRAAGKKNEMKRKKEA